MKSVGWLLYYCFPSLSLFFNNMYGLSGIWCWIKLTNGDCHSETTLGVVYHFTLYYGPFSIFVFCSCVACIAIVIVRYCKGRVAIPHHQALKEALPLLAYPLIYNIFFTITLANHVYHAIATVKDEDPIFPLLLAHAVAESLQVILAALAFFLHPNIFKRVFCKKPTAEITATELMTVSHMSMSAVTKEPADPTSMSDATVFNVSIEFPGDDPLQIIGSNTTKNSLLD